MVQIENTICNFFFFRSVGMKQLSLRTQQKFRPKRKRVQSKLPINPAKINLIRVKTLEVPEKPILKRKSNINIFINVLAIFMH